MRRRYFSIAALLLLAAGCGAGIDDGTLLSITVTGVPEGVQSLRLTTSIGTRRAEMAVPAAEHYIGVRVPADASGHLRLEVAGLLPDGCFQSRGTAEASLEGQPRIDLTVSLGGLAGRLCPLRVDQDGDGFGWVTSEPASLECGQGCTADVPTGSRITIAATALGPTDLATLSGGCQGDRGEVSRCEVQVAGPTQVLARFETNRLRVGVSDPALGAVRSVPAGIDCGQSCAAAFARGTALTLQAAPAPGQALVGWDGPCEQRGALSCTLTLSGPAEVKARFSAVPALTSLSLTGVPMSPAFAPLSTMYTARVAPWIERVELLASGAAGDTVRVNGEAISPRPSATVALKDGANVLAVDVVAGSGAVRSYTVVVTRGPASIGYLKASNPSARDRLGVSVAISGDTLAVGAPYEDGRATGVNGNQGDLGASSTNAGAVYVFRRSGATWAQEAYLKASFYSVGGFTAFGSSLSLSGDTLAVGAATRGVFIFRRTGTTWAQEALLQQGYYGSPNDDPQYLEGPSVSLSGDTLAIGNTADSSSATGVNGNEAPGGASGSGAVFVFRRTGTSWSREAYLKASNTGSGDRFGHSVSLEGDVLVAGAPYEASSALEVNGNQGDNSMSEHGAAYVFRRSGTTWAQEAYLKPFLYTGNTNWFGRSVSLSGDTIAVGAPWDSYLALASGAVFVFRRGGTGWAKEGYIKVPSPSESDFLGYALALEGDTLAVGAFLQSGGYGNGAVYVLRRSGTSWSQQASLKSAYSSGDWLGYSVALSSGTLVTGAPQEDSQATGVGGEQDNNSKSDSGAVYVYQ